MTINLIGKQNDKREGKYSAKQNNITRQAQCLVRPWGGGPPVLNFFWKDGLTDGLARKEPHQTNLTFKPRQQILSTNLPQSVVVPNTCQKFNGAVVTGETYQKQFRVNFLDVWLKMHRKK